MPPPKDPSKRAEWLRKQSESHKGKTPWMKGRHHTEESNEKNRLSKLGNTFRRGKTNSPEHRKKNSIAQLGKISPFKDKKHTTKSKELNRLAHLGKLHTEEWKKEKSLAMMGENNPFFDKHHTDKTKFDISKANTGKVPWIKDKTHTPETRALLRESRLRQVIPQKDTKPERIMQIALELRGVQYQKHAPILGQPDVFIEPDLCIFVDGDATHGNPRFYDLNDKIAFGVIARDRWIKDQSITRRLIKEGYKVLRIWQDDIETDADKCVQFIEYFRDRFLVKLA